MGVKIKGEAASCEHMRTQHIPSSREFFSVTGCSLTAKVLPDPRLCSHPSHLAQIHPLSPFRSPTPYLILWLWLKVEGHYVRMLDMNSLKRLEYCSGFTVEISAPAPCFTVLAAWAAFFLASYGVRISMMAMK